MLFLVDAQLPPLLAKDLRAAGFDVLHIADLNLLAATDVQIWSETVARSAVFITKDRDFALLPVALHVRLTAGCPPAISILRPEC
ncbi:MAG: DUF5615 family PIN-like protein [Hyphomicrobiales bacterium]|nr:DUF5615 family PIN-like protein [Hyphomicrobiales bacterium]